MKIKFWMKGILMKKIVLVVIVLLMSVCMSYKIMFEYVVFYNNGI